MEKISFISFSKSHNKNKIFNKFSLINRDSASEPFIYLKKYLRKKGYDLSTSDINTIEESKYIIATKGITLKQLIIITKLKKFRSTIYWATEPAVVFPLHAPIFLKIISNIFRAVLTWNDDIVDGKKIFKYHVPIPDPPDEHVPIVYEQKKFLTMVAANKSSRFPGELYSARRKAIEYFEKTIPNDFDLYGYGWEQNKHPSYKGSIKTKYDILKNYKFCICYENQRSVNGLITEKIFDCFYARTIPIFWGADNVDQYLPLGTYINKKDHDPEKILLQYINNINYIEYTRYIKNIEKYIKGKQIKKHSKEELAKLVFAVLRLVD